jgi:hypothetical protein
MSEWVRWFCAVLATLRLTWALMYEDGPGSVLFCLRNCLGTYDYDEQPGPDGPEPKTAVGRFFHCPYCVSLALAPIAALLALFPSLAGDLLLAWMGVAGAAMLAVRWRPWRNNQ